MKPRPRTTDLRSACRKELAGNTAGALSHSPAFGFLLPPFHFKIISVAPWQRMTSSAAYLFSPHAEMIPAGVELTVPGVELMVSHVGLMISRVLLMVSHVEPAVPVVELMVSHVELMVPGVEKKSPHLNLLKKGIFPCFSGLCIVVLIYYLTFKI